MTVTTGPDCVDEIRAALDQCLSQAHATERADENKGCGPYYVCQTANAQFHVILPETADRCLTPLRKKADPSILVDIISVSLVRRNRQSIVNDENFAPR